MLQKLSLKSVRIRLVLTIAVIIISVFLMGLWIFENGQQEDGQWKNERLEDLFVNLISDSIGVIVIGLLIPYLMKQREEKRWLPAKRLLYAKLMTLIEDLLQEMVPEDFRKTVPQMYAQGDICVFSKIDLENSLLRDLSKLPLLVERDWYRRELFDGKITTRVKRQLSKIDESASHTKEQLDTVLYTAAFLLDHEPIRLLWRLNRDIEPLQTTLVNLSKATEWTEENKKVFVVSLSDVILAAVEAGVWLVCKIEQYFVRQ